MSGARRQVARRPRPGHGFAEQLHAEIASDLKFVGAGKSERKAVRLAFVWIVDPTRIPTSVGLLFEIAKNRQAADRSFALRFIWIVTVEKRLPFIVERFFEPYQLAAQFVSARFDVDRSVPRVVIPDAKLFASRSGAQGRCENRS